LALSLPPGYLSPNPTGIPPQVQYGDDLCLVFCFQIVNAKGKSARQHSVTSILLAMNSMVQGEAFNVRQKRSDTILSNPGLLRIVKTSRRFQVVGRLHQDDHPSHADGFCKRFFSSVTGRNSPSPRPILASREVRISSCQAGEDTPCGSRLIEAQSSSMAWSLSSRLIRSI